MMTWILRLVGAVLMFVGFSMLFRPLSVIADVLPIAGTIVGAGTGLIAFLLTVVLSFSVIAVAWIFYRPLIGIPLILVAVAGLVFLVMKLMGQKKRQAGLAPS
jgi:predicted Kef-type K+ transport protein